MYLDDGKSFCCILLQIVNSYTIGFKVFGSEVNDIIHASYRIAMLPRMYT